LVLLELKGLEEVIKFSLFSPSSLLVVKLISVERIDSAFLGALLAACSLFTLQLPFECINFIKKKVKEFFLGPALASKQSLFCCLNLAIALKPAVLWLVLPQYLHHMLDPLGFLEYLPTLMVANFSSSTPGSVVWPLMRLIFSKFF
jgi:hypothetical protein